MKTIALPIFLLLSSSTVFGSPKPARSTVLKTGTYRVMNAEHASHGALAQPSLPARDSDQKIEVLPNNRLRVHQASGSLEVQLRRDGRGLGDGLLGTGERYDPQSLTRTKVEVSIQQHPYRSLHPGLKAIEIHTTSEQPGARPMSGLSNYIGVVPHAE